METTVETKIIGIRLHCGNETVNTHVIAYAVRLQISPVMVDAKVASYAIRVHEGIEWEKIRELIEEEVTWGNIGGDIEDNQALVDYIEQHTVGDIRDQIDGKADKPTTFTAGHIAEFDEHGNPIDSGKVKGDFAASVHNHDDVYAPKNHTHTPDHVIADDEENDGYLVLNLGNKSYAIARTEIVVPEVNVKYGNETNPATVSVTTVDKTGNITVEISNNVAGAEIFYTTDNTDPKTSNNRQTYSGAFKLDLVSSGSDNPATRVVKVRARKQGRWSVTMRVVTFSITRKLKTPTITIADPSGSGTTGTATLGKVTNYGQDIYYTTDDSDPKTDGTKYTAPFSVSSNTKIRCISLLENWLDSEEATPVQKKFTVKKPSITAGGTFSVTKSVELSGTTTGATIRYTIDGTTPTASSPAYSSAISVTKTNTTIKAKAFLNSDWNDSEVAESTFVLKVDKPTISVDSDDVYAASHTITIAAPSQSGTTVYYTTDGSDPTSSDTRQQYSAPFAISTRGTFTVKAVAVKTDWTSNSDTMSGIVVAKRYTHVLLTDSTSTPSEATIEAAAMASPAENPIGTYTLNNSGSAEKQMWICVPKAYGHTIPSNGVTNDDGWTQPVTSSSTTNYYVYRVGAGLGGGSSITLKVVSVN